MIEVRIKFTTNQAFVAWQWCKDNSIKASGVDKGGGYNKGGFYCFSFECEEDAMAFKLRWL